MSVNIDTKDNTEEVLRALNNAIERGLDAIGLTAETYAKINLRDFPRVDTGNLMNSVTHERRADGEYVGTRVKYAYWVEYGTRRMAASHFLRDAATGHRDEYKKLMEDSLRNA